jgi:hypothetical protein
MSFSVFALCLANCGPTPGSGLSLQTIQTSLSVGLLPGLRALGLGPWALGFGPLGLGLGPWGLGPWALGLSAFEPWASSLWPLGLGLWAFGPWASGLGPWACELPTPGGVLVRMCVSYPHLVVC